MNKNTNYWDKIYIDCNVARKRSSLIPVLFFCVVIESQSMHLRSNDLFHVFCKLLCDLTPVSLHI